MSDSCHHQDPTLPSENRFYVVDDDEQVCLSTCFMLTTLGLNCTGFASRDQFLSEAAELRPGCILLDVKMPGPPIESLQSYLARLHSSWSIVLMSGSEEDGIERVAAGGHALGFVSKPFSEDQLLTALERCSTTLQ